MLAEFLIRGAICVDECEVSRHMGNQQQILYALAECRIDYRYVNIIKNVYENAKACIKLHDYTEDFPTGWCYIS